MSDIEKESYLSFVSVRGSKVDFRNIDLSPWGIMGGFIENGETESFIRSISISKQDEHNWKRIKTVSQSVDDESRKHTDWRNMNLLWPIDLKNPPELSDYFEAVEAIRIISPSEIFIQNTFGIQYFEDVGIFVSGWSIDNSYQWLKYSNPEAHYFNYPIEYLKELNVFLAYYWKTYKERDYIVNAIRYYSDSFRVNSREMAFICLCICLETIVPGKDQLSYRFRRNLAVLCSDSKEQGDKIYENAKKLYALRSELVHAGLSKKGVENFESYYIYAQILASRMIIEMILHDFPTIKELDDKLTQFGFGHGNIISDKYKVFKDGTSTWLKVFEYEL